jgi:hypothetical protein
MYQNVDLVAFTHELIVLDIGHLCEVLLGVIRSY